MPALSSHTFADAILDAIEQSGDAGVLLSGAGVHPRRLVTTGPEGPLSVWIYAWTLTPGGRPQLQNEYRIQMTSVSSPLPLNPEGPTVLMGYDPNLRVFGGFDIARHRTFTPGSSSVQIDITALRQALQDGLAFHRKSNGEITMAIRPDQFMVYVRHAPLLHKTGRDLRGFRALTRAASGQAADLPDLDALSTSRRKIVQTITRNARDANFKQQVLQAYASRCAVTGIQLRLIEAAHILPVATPGSPDDVRNGIALSPTYHRAYDCGLIFLDEQFEMRVNPKKESHLHTLQLDGGIVQFKASLGRVLLPQDKRQWPHSAFIRKANKYRGI